MVELIWSPKSLNDLKSIFDYISMDSVEHAHLFVNSIIEVTTSIPQFPLQGRVVPEFREINLREMLFKNYRIIYRIKTDCIEIVTILHNARLLNLRNIHPM